MVGHINTKCMRHHVTLLYLLLQGLDGGIPRTNTILVRPQILDLLLRELEVKHLCILPDPRARDRLDQRDIPPLQTPPQQHLRLRLAVLVRQGRDLGLFAEALPSHNGAVGLHDDVARAAPAHDVRARKPRVQLPLPDGDDPALALAALGLEFLDVGLQLLEVVHAVVADADATNLACVHGVDEGAPCTFAVCAAAKGRVDEDEVEVVELRLGEGGVDGVGCDVVVEPLLEGGRDLGCEENGGAGD